MRSLGNPPRISPLPDRLPDRRRGARPVRPKFRDRRYDGDLLAHRRPGHRRDRRRRGRRRVLHRAGQPHRGGPPAHLLAHRDDCHGGRTVHGGLFRALAAPVGRLATDPRTRSSGRGDYDLGAYVGGSLVYQGGLGIDPAILKPDCDPCPTRTTRPRWQGPSCHSISARRPSTEKTRTPGFPSPPREPGSPPRHPV